MKTSYLTLIQSGRVSPQTRKLLLSRLTPDAPTYQARAISQQQLNTLRSVLAQGIPQRRESGDPEIDLAARLDLQLAEGLGDGWRYASLPPDAEAFRIGLSLIDDFAHKLSAVPYTALAPAAQQSILDAIASGRLHSSRLDLKRWFEDLRAIATQIYVAHPQTLSRLNYSGIADDQGGFVQLGIGQVEPWEPKEADQ